MDEEFAGRLGYIEVVLKESADCGRYFRIKGCGFILSKDLTDEDPAEVPGQLIDQSADAKAVIGNDGFIRIEDPADVHGHLGFLKGFGQVLQLMDHCAVGGYGFDHSLHIEHIYRGFRHLIQSGVIIAFCFHLFDQDQAALLDFRQIVTVLGCKKTGQGLSGNFVVGGADLKEDDGPVDLVGYMQLPGPGSHIYQQQVVQEQILEEIMPVITFFVSCRHMLQLTDCHPGYHKGIVSAAGRGQYKGDSLIIHDLEQEAGPYDLAVYRGFSKCADNRFRLRLPELGTDNDFTGCVLQAEFCSCYFP